MSAKIRPSDLIRGCVYTLAIGLSIQNAGAKTERPGVAGTGGSVCPEGPDMVSMPTDAPQTAPQLFAGTGGSVCPDGPELVVS